MEHIDLNLLAALNALLQEISVTQAAEKVGLSTPAMSHALARLREQLKDPLLVRAGRGMVLTPRAEELRLQIPALLAAARQALSPVQAFSPAKLRREFVLCATDHLLTLLGVTLDRLIRAEAPMVSLRFIPNTIDDASLLREGNADLAVGIYGELPPELRTRQLFTDRFVCVSRQDNPFMGTPLTLDKFCALEHIQVAPRGRPGGYVDDVLALQGLTRRVARVVPYFQIGLLLTAETDYLLTISERIAKSAQQRLPLRVMEPPLPLLPYALSMLWHPRFDADSAHRWLREKLLEATKETVINTHLNARTKLEPLKKP
jgi:DNA-binding transcriptional LysR family regulator